MQTETPSPNPQYDFIFNGSNQPKKGLRLSLPNLPKPILWTIGAVIAVILLVIVYSIIKNSGAPNPQPYINTAGRAQEISRVSSEVDNLTKDENTKNLATTTAASLSSQSDQIVDYAKSIKLKISNASLAAFKDTSIDDQLQSAVTSDSLPAVYEDYLKKQLTTYKTDLQTAFQTAGPRGKAMLQSAYNSADVILNSL